MPPEPRILTALQNLEDNAAMQDLIQRRPPLTAYAQLFYKTGLPLNALKARIMGEFGLDIAEEFIQAAGNQVAQVTMLDEPAEMQGELCVKHGRLGDPAWPAPQLAARCADIARPGYNSSAAHEYLDTSDVLRAKVRVMANLVRKAKRLVIYAGAGLSTASGISDYATRAGNASIANRKGRASHVQSSSPYSAMPSLGHRVIAALARAGYVWRFVQQNHDGLPQKAGVPQKLMNEIHGGWFDPSNPVVPMKGGLREDLFGDLLQCERQADLVLALGSSLCGMNADRLVSTCASRARRSVPADPVFGSVIVALQRTPHDANSSVRLFATIDDVLCMLAEELALYIEPADQAMTFPVSPDYLPLGPEEHVFSVPYDEHGKLMQDGGVRRSLDLRDHAELTIAIGKNKGQPARVLGRNEDGHYRIAICHTPGGIWNDVRLLGKWWPAAAVAGELNHMPVVSSTFVATAA
jgi:hypothetical protein